MNIYKFRYAVRNRLLISGHWYVIVKDDMVCYWMFIKYTPSGTIDRCSCYIDTIGKHYHKAINTNGKWIKDKHMDKAEIRALLMKFIKTHKTRDYTLVFEEDR